MRNLSREFVIAIIKKNQVTGSNGVSTSSVKLHPKVHAHRWFTLILMKIYSAGRFWNIPCPDNPHHNAFHTEATLLASEARAQRILDPLAGRFWKIVNPSVRNRLGEPVAYKLMPGENVLPFAQRPEAAVTRRAGFMTKHVWVTRHDPRERYARRASTRMSIRAGPGCRAT